MRPRSDGVTVLSSRFHNRRRAGAVSSWVLMGLAALSTAPAARQLADAQAAYGNYPHEGCFRDNRKRVLPYQETVRPLTLEGCAAACLANKRDCDYAGLEYGQECFCGKELPKVSATNCDMVYEKGSEIVAGGKWAISVYNLGLTDANTNGVTNEESTSESESESDSEEVYAVGNSQDSNPGGDV
ncbi:unnamed protein product, partial [Laminaria digitata]